MREQIKAKHKALVVKYDTNKNGRLDPEEMKTARKTGEKVPKGGGHRESERKGSSGRAPAAPTE